MMDWAYFEVDRFERAKGALDRRQTFISEHGGLRRQRFARDIGAQHVKAVQPRLSVDLLYIAGKGEAGLGDAQIEQLAHLASLKRGADGQADFVLAVLATFGDGG